MTGTVAPGKQCVDALNNLMFLTIESPTIKVDGENRDEGKKAVGLLGWKTHHPKEQRKKKKR